MEKSSSVPSMEAKGHPLNSKEEKRRKGGEKRRRGKRWRRRRRRKGKRSCSDTDTAGEKQGIAHQRLNSCYEPSLVLGKYGGYPVECREI